MGDAHAVRPRAAARPAIPRLSRQAGFGVVAYGRRAVLLPAIGLTVVAAVLFVVWQWVLARSAPPELTLPFDVFAVALLLALLAVAIAIAPEAHPGLRPRPRYRP